MKIRVNICKALRTVPDNTQGLCVHYYSKTFAPQHLMDLNLNAPKKQRDQNCQIFSTLPDLISCSRLSKHLEQDSEEGNTVKRRKEKEPRVVC